MIENLDLYPKKNNYPDLQTIRYMPKSLSDLDVNQELLEVYMRAKYFLQDLSAVEMGEIPANQIAQVMNTILSTLKELAKIQSDMHNVNTIKKMEAAIMKAIQNQPEEVKKAFLHEYAKAAK